MDEVAALNDKEIVLSNKNIVISNLRKRIFASVFVKSSTGFYTTENNVPNGATIPSITDVRKCNTTPVKAGGVRTYDEAVEMIKLGGE
jgi:deoxyribose-phosphate aldolase